MGRLLGTVLSGVIYQQFGLLACLGIASVLMVLASFFVRKITYTH
jgi:hypothetical protein